MEVYFDTAIPDDDALEIKDAYERFASLREELIAGGLSETNVIIAYLIAADEMAVTEIGEMH